MLVVTHAESSPVQIAAVCQRARAAGSDAIVYDIEPAIIVESTGPKRLEVPESTPRQSPDPLN